MSIVTFVHAADLHLDSPFAGLRNVHPEIASILHQATFDAYHNIIDLCIMERVDALLVAGDVFDGADRSLRAQVQFAAGLHTLHKAGIQSFICHGNHDPLNGWEAQIDLPASCHRFGPSVQRVPVFKDEPYKVMVHGISYPQREVRHNLIPEFGRAESGPFHIGLLHANVGNVADHDAYAPCRVADLEQTGIDYWALGHVHSRQILRHPTPTVVYPGNPQGRHPHETGARGVYLVAVSESREVSIDFRSVDVVRWAAACVDIGTLQSDQDLLNTIDDKLAELQVAADGRALIVRLLLSGRGELHTHLARADFMDDLLTLINGNWMRQSPLLWCERIEVSTAAALDRQQRRQGTDFVADLLRLSDAVRNDDTSIADMRHLLNDLYGRGQVSRYLRDHLPGDDDIRQMITDAEALCLAELLEADDE
jgi:DNA repair exonuclease SbcCD nuclease subunit